MQSLNTILSADNSGSYALNGEIHATGTMINTGQTRLTGSSNAPATIIDPRPPAPAQGVNFTLIINANNVTLSHLRFTGRNAIALRINGDNCTLENLVFEDVMIAFVCSGKNLSFKNITIRRFSEDGLRLAGDNFHGENIRIEDLYAANQEAHHDGIQLYAGKPGSPLRSAERFEGKHALSRGYLKNVQIRSTTNPRRDRIGQLQGIFSADGFLDGLQLENIQVETHNVLHGVSLRGLRTAQDSTPSSLKNITVRQTPGTSGLAPRINLLPARRMAAVRAPGLPQWLSADADENNLYELLFPPDIFRTETDLSGDLPGPGQRPGPSFWHDIPNGARDALQGRNISYEPMLELLSAPLYQRLNVLPVT